MSTAARVRSVALVAVAALPVVAAAVRAVAHGWYPLGDNALYALRARDVLTSNHPLLGTWSSASLSSGVDVNHPGPLLFDLLAIPARVDPLRGVPVGVATLHVAVIVAIAWAAHRRGGPAALAVAMAATAALVWSLGSEMVIDPWQPNVMLLPFLLFLVLVWGVWCDDVVLLPVAVGVGSLLVETHLSYALLVPALLVLSLLVLAVRLVVRRRAGGPDRADARGTAGWLLVAAVVGGLLWAQPVVEQLTGPGQGNLARLVTTRGGDEERAGLVLAARLVAGVETAPPFWLRPSYGDTYSVPLPGPRPTRAQADASGLPSTGTAAVGLATLLAVLGAAGWWAWRRQRTIAATAVALAAVLLGLVLVSTAIQPFNPVLGLGGHQVAWLWPTGAFIALAVVSAAGLQGRASVVLGGGITLALCILALPARNAEMGPRLYDDAAPSMEAIGQQLGELTGGPFLVDTGNLYFGEPYSTATMLELQRHGIDFVVDEDGLARQVGEGRRFTGTAQGRLYLEIGEAATAAHPPSHRRVAFVRGLRPDEVDDLREATLAVEVAIRAGGLRLSPAGQAALAADELPVLARGGPGLAEELVSSRELVRIVRSGYVDPAAPGSRVLRHWADLQHRDDTLTVGVFIAPMDEPAPGRQ